MIDNEPAGKPEDAMAAFQGILDAMMNLADGLETSGAPPRAMEALTAAMTAYQEFLSVISGGSRQGSRPAQGGAEMAIGNPNARAVP